MTRYRSGLGELLGRVLTWVRTEMRGETVDQLSQHFDQYADEFTEHTRISREAAAWCRVTAAWLRDEDVPPSIYPEDGENPADTARWKKWRVS